VVSRCWKKDAFRLSLDVLYGSDFEGGHPETKGLTPAGQVITVPGRRHEVTLDLTRIQISTDYALADDWQGRLRLPYDIKDQESEVTFVESATAAEREAMLRNLEIHHRDETYSGFGDASLLAAHRLTDVL